MKPCKRIEIVIEHSLAPRVTAKLDELASGYTVISRAGGRGDRGSRSDDDPTGTFTNTVFIVACESDAQVQTIVESLRPLLSRSGGICLVSDALWLKH